MLPKLFNALRTPRTPAGYRPGVTLEHLRRNLGIADFHWLEAHRAQVRIEHPPLAFEVIERVESQLLMHLVMSEFVLHIPASVQGVARLELHHTGSISRTGLRCRQRSGDVAALAAINTLLEPGSPLFQVLMPLDFKRLQIDKADALWTVRLEHMGGSEVVNRMPAFRRYIRLSDEQRALLLSTLEFLAQGLRSI